MILKYILSHSEVERLIAGHIVPVVVGKEHVVTVDGAKCESIEIALPLAMIPSVIRTMLEEEEHRRVEEASRSSEA